MSNMTSESTFPFLVIHNVGNISIFILLRFKNELDREILIRSCTKMPTLCITGKLELIWQ